MNKFKRFVYTSFRLFAVRKEERLTVAIALLAFSLLNAVTVWKYWDVFSIPNDNYHRLFVRHFQRNGRTRPRSPSPAAELGPWRATLARGLLLALRFSSLQRAERGGNH